MLYQLRMGEELFGKGSELKLVGKWMEPQGVNEFTLKPKEERSFTYKLTVPADITPGQYVGVIAAEELIKAAEQNPNIQGQQASLAIDVVNRSGVQMVLEYKADQAKHNMSIDSFKHDYVSSGYSRLTVELSNSGTILEKPKGKIRINDSKGQIIYKQDYAAESIYGGTTADMVYIVNETLLLPDTYEAYYEATFSGKTISRTFSFSISPEQSNVSKEALIQNGKIEVTQTFWDWLELHLWVVILVIIIIVIFFFLFFGCCYCFGNGKRKRKKRKSLIRRLLNP